MTSNAQRFRVVSRGNFLSRFTEYSRWNIMILLGICLAGCSQGDGIAVVGTIEWRHGQSLESGSVVFEPIGSTAAPRVAGRVDAGRFSIPARDHVCPGRYIVRIYSTSTVAGFDDPRVHAKLGSAILPQELVAKEFNRDSKLMVDITADNHEFSFVIEPAAVASDHAG